MIALDLELLLGQEEACTFAFAVTEEEAIEEARAHRPDMITFDVTLLEGTGPAAVETIRNALRLACIEVSERPLPGRR